MTVSDRDFIGTRVLRRDGADFKLDYRRAVARILEGPDTGKQSTLSEDRLSVGTAEGNDLRPSDESVSRFHAEIRREDGGFRLRDLGSTNGTWVNGVRVVEAVLGGEATIRFGETTVRLSVTSEFENIPLHPTSAFGAMFGGSVPMRALFARLARVATTDATVLILGESGTGKELAAHAIHEHSARAKAPFIVVDCGSIPPDLVESELFGHEKGAFTGADRERRGAFEAADGGTIFLDEIGELPLASQPKLLRALESRQIKRVGTEKHRRVNVRVVAATHRELRESVNRGTFREDLFFRLAVATIRMPPLRERIDDLPLLLKRLWTDTLRSLGLDDRPMPELKSELLQHLMSLPWEGNVRELRNFVERSVAFSRDLLPSFLDACPPPTEGGPDLRFDLPFKDAKALWNDHFEKAYLAHRLRATGGNVSQLAREAEVDRPHLIKLLRKHLIK
jgi:DNA-binding NtrC family response regulator